MTTTDMWRDALAARISEDARRPAEILKSVIVEHDDSGIPELAGGDTPINRVIRLRDTLSSALSDVTNCDLPIPREYLQVYQQSTALLLKWLEAADD